MGRSTTDTCALTLPLKLEKWQSDRLEKRLEIARQLYNTLLRYELKKLRPLEENPEYINLQRILKETKDESKRDRLKSKMKVLCKKAGLTEEKLKEDMGGGKGKGFYLHFKTNIGSSVAVHGIASQLWTAFDKLFFGDGETVHFKKRGELNSICGASVSGISGGYEIMFRYDKELKENVIKWNGLILRIKFDPKNQYEVDMLKNRIKYCRIIRKHGRNKCHWYVQLMLECKPVVKHDKNGDVRHPIGSGAVGIDIGPQTIAYVSDGEAVLKELANKVNNINREKRILQRKLDRSRRATNPDNYNPDGTIKRGVKLTHNKSKRYLRTQRILYNLLRKQAVIRKWQHNELANHLLSLGDRFYVENMDWPSLTHRAKKTEISEKTGKYKRKKRFGKSVGNKAPATLISMLDLKLKSRGMSGVTTVQTTVKASQYNHLLDEYHKKELYERWNNMPDGRRVQRDLYSAFLLQHMNAQIDGFDKEGLDLDYPKFVVLHDQCIEELKNAPKTIASMGIVRKGN